MAKKKSNAGRPPSFTPEVVKKLEEAFAIDATVEEACFYAGISRPTYYDNVKEGSELFNRFKDLRNRPVLLARQTVVKRVSESYSNAMDYLKRKRKLEFGDSADITSGGEKINTFDDKQINDIARRVLNGNPAGEEKPN